jgi:hypothetical protein
MPQKRDDVLKHLSQDELINLYTTKPEGPGRIQVLEELARRGVEWASALAAFERDQYQLDRANRRHIVDLPEVQNGMDSEEALANIPEYLPRDQFSEKSISLRIITTGLRQTPDKPLICNN